ncbi:PREDICTED: delta-like protein 1, partial [Amphimedon queenslandica]|uniref:EGF-like domain-containing protein n=1 Tax=Amphimedon queenslandica TaxID=400682 RepID=A0A1X7T7Y5_AMPQE
LCGDDKLCLFDVAATGDLSIGEATKEVEEDLQILEEILQPTVCDPQCVNGACVGNNSCFCSEGYQGIACNQPVLNECEENICVNGGTCSLIAGDTVCSCLDLYTGINCEDLISSPTSSPSLTPSSASLSVLLVIVFVALAVIIGVIVLILVAIFCIQKKKRDLKNPSQLQSTNPFYNDDPEGDTEAYELDWHSKDKKNEN